MTRLDHPNIVVAHDAGQIGDSCCLAMEFVDGINLAVLLNQTGPLPIPLACDLVRQTALALQHAHDRNLVHRDVKPSNLMVVRAADRPPLIKVLDFGLARFIAGAEAQSRLTKIGGRVGTVDFIAPEQVVDARLADPRSDVFSLGATLFSILTGEPLYPGKDSTERLEARLQSEPRRFGFRSRQLACRSGRRGGDAPGPRPRPALSQCCRRRPGAGAVLPDRGLAALDARRCRASAAAGRAEVIPARPS